MVPARGVGKRAEPAEQLKHMYLLLAERTPSGDGHAQAPCAQYNGSEPVAGRPQHTCVRTAPSTSRRRNGWLDMRGMSAPSCSAPSLIHMSGMSPIFCRQRVGEGGGRAWKAMQALDAHTGAIQRKALHSPVATNTFCALPCPTNSFSWCSRQRPHSASSSCAGGRMAQLSSWPVHVNLSTPT